MRKALMRCKGGSMPLVCSNILSVWRRVRFSPIIREDGQSLEIQSVTISTVLPCVCVAECTRILAEKR